MVTPNAGDGVEELNLSCFAGGRVQRYSHSKQLGSFSEN